MITGKKLASPYPLVSTKDKFIDAFGSITQGVETGILFSSVTEDDILKAESRVGTPFPEPLKDFWRTIGAGHIMSSGDGSITVFQNNVFLRPATLASLICLDDDFRLLLDDEDDERFSFPKGDFPFFDMGDSFYLCIDEKGEIRNSSWFLDEPRPITSDIWDFANRLLQNPGFYE